MLHTYRARNSKSFVFLKCFEFLKYGWFFIQSTISYAFKEIFSLWFVLHSNASHAKLVQTKYICIRQNSVFSRPIHLQKIYIQQNLIPQFIIYSNGVQFVYIFETDRLQQIQLHPTVRCNIFKSHGMELCWLLHK